MNIQQETTKLKEEIEELRKNWNDNEYQNKYLIQLDAKLQAYEDCLKEMEKRENEVLEIIDKIDTEKYIGEYCFKANLFKKELKQKIKGEK